MTLTHRIVVVAALVFGFYVATPAHSQSADPQPPQGVGPQSGDLPAPCAGRARGEGGRRGGGLPTGGPRGEGRGLRGQGGLRAGGARAGGRGGGRSGGGPIARGDGAGRRGGRGPNPCVPPPAPV